MLILRTVLRSGLNFLELYIIYQVRLLERELRSYRSRFYQEL